MVEKERENVQETNAKREREQEYSNVSILKRRKVINPKQFKIDKTSFAGKAFDSILLKKFEDDDEEIEEESVKSVEKKKEDVKTTDAVNEQKMLKLIDEIKSTSKSTENQRRRGFASYEKYHETLVKQLNASMNLLKSIPTEAGAASSHLESLNNHTNFLMKIKLRKKKLKVKNITGNTKVDTVADQLDAPIFLRLADPKMHYKQASRSGISSNSPSARKTLNKTIFGAFRRTGDTCVTQKTVKMPFVANRITKQGFRSQKKTRPDRTFGSTMYRGSFSYSKAESKKTYLMSYDLLKKTIN